MARRKQKTETIEEEVVDDIGVSDEIVVEEIVVDIPEQVPDPQPVHYDGILPRSASRYVHPLR